MEHILEVLRNLSFLGERYAVGGCVRDYLMGLEPHDIDVAVKMRPEDVIKACDAQKIPAKITGDGHGTVTLILNGEAVEVTTFRRDVSTDGRRATVEFADTIEEDISRRDYTINALAIEPGGYIVDPCGGQKDIDNNILRTVGDANKRFEEDYLRIVRGARFAARFNLTVEGKTYFNAYFGGENVYKYVSVERFVDEVTKAFYQCERPSVFLEYLREWGILYDFLPEMHEMVFLNQHPLYHPEGTVHQHTLQVVDNAPPEYRWHALFHDIGKPETAQIVDNNDYYSFHGHEAVGAEMISDIAERLKLPNDLRNEIEATTRLHMYPLQYCRNGTLNARNIRKFQVMCGGYLHAVEAVVRADRMNRLGPTNEFLNELFTPLPEEIKPVLMGRDLIEAGFQPGPDFGRMLKRAFDYQIEEGCLDKNKLLQEATNGQ